MRAVVLRELGDPEVLRLEEVPDPQPGPGEVLVRLEAAALNHRDVWIRKGLYAGIKVPIILGADGAGEVVAVGEGVDSSFVGWRVVINPALDWGKNPRVQGPNFRILGLPDDGTYAELVKVPASSVHPIPTGLSVEEAAAIPLAGLTAYRAVVTRGQVRPDEIVLITGVGGGVATFALQIARFNGARVFVTSGMDEKLDRARALGAEGGVNYKHADWPQQLKDQMSGAPDLIIDSVGGATFDTLLDLAAPGGRLVSYGATLGAVPNLAMRRVFWKQLTILGSTMGTDQEFADMLKLFDSGAIAPVVDQVFPLAEAAAAHRRMEEAGQFGKIVLRVG
jgi:NADPH:quinone reductase-like Zn-dependent oxidoreductase